jgi:CRISPR-associated endonuclease Cas2
MKYLILYDIPRELKSFQVFVNRALKKAGAVKFQQSAWECNNLENLREIAKTIRAQDGRVVILEKKIVASV